MRAIIKTIAVAFAFIAACGFCEHAIAQEKYVFASYMVGSPLAGEDVTIDDFLSDIRAAHAAGIDGFALNCGEWNGTPRYKKYSAMMFEAAQRFGPNFKLFFSADRLGAAQGFDLSADEAADMVVQYHNHPNQLRYQGRPVLSTFTGDSVWFHAIRDKIRQQIGEDVFLIPSFYPPSRREVPNAQDLRELTAQSDGFDGFFYFGAAGNPVELADAIRLNANAWSKNDKLFMAGIAPYYRGLFRNYRVFEYNGYDGLVRQWMAAIQSATDWVELVTWNDWSEDTYFSPLGATDDVVRSTKDWGYLLTHDGFLAATRYFSEWFKSGQQPAVDREQVFYAYRLHRRYAPGRPNPYRTEVGWPLGAFELNDQVNVLGLLHAPAEIVLGNASSAEAAVLGAGMGTVALPMENGPLLFTVKRNGTTIGAKMGEFPISVMDGWSNFNVLAGEIPIASDALVHPKKQ
jgi:hypothetical protein